jgi:transcriptional regulator with XRE-family HTH domain
MASKIYTPAERAGGQWLRDRRIAAGLTQNELARLLGLKYYTWISQLEAGQQVPPDKYAEFAHALKMDPKEFTREQLRFFQPEVFKILFGDEERRIGPVKSRSSTDKQAE